MKNKSLHWFTSILIVCALGTDAQNLEAEVLSIRSDNWMPFNGDSNKQNQGYIIDLVREIFEPHGISIDYQITPWARSLILCKKGKVNAVVGAAEVDVEGFVLPKEALDYTYEAFFKLAENEWQYDGNIISLESQELGYIIDYATRPDVIAYLNKYKNTKKVQLVGGNNPLGLNIKKLALGRISVLLENSNVVRYRLHKMGLSDKIVFAGNLYKHPVSMYIAFSPNHPKSQTYADLFDKGFRDLKANGRVNVIRQKYSMNALD